MTFVKRLLAPALLGLLVLPLFAAGAQAQTAAQFGYVDPDLIIVRVPEYRAIQDSLASEQEAIQQELAGMQQQFQAQVEQYQEQAGMLSADARAARENELRAVQQQLQQRQGEAVQALGQREAEMIQPLLTRLQGAIDTIAEREGLTMVFATRANNAPVLLYADDSAMNISQMVMAELGMEATATGE